MIMNVLHNGAIVHRKVSTIMDINSMLYVE